MHWTHCAWLTMHLSTCFCPETLEKKCNSFALLQVHPEYTPIRCTDLPEFLQPFPVWVCFALATAAVLAHDHFRFHPKWAQCTQLLKEEVLALMSRDTVSWIQTGVLFHWEKKKKTFQKICHAWGFKLSHQNSTQSQHIQVEQTLHEETGEEMSEARCFKHCTEFTLLFSPSNVLAFNTSAHSRRAPALRLFWSRLSHAYVQPCVSGHTSLVLYLLAASQQNGFFLEEDWKRWSVLKPQRRNKEFTETNPGRHSKLQQPVCNSPWVDEPEKSVDDVRIKELSNQLSSAM